MSTLLLIHICAAIVGLFSGAMAVLSRKGSGRHGAAGTVFFVSMLCMSASGAYIAAFMKPNRLNLMMATLTFYLVATSWVAAKRREARVGLFDWVALLVIFADGAAGWSWGLASKSGFKGIFFVFGTIALLCAFADLRMIMRGGVSGTQRIVRHLWRMCFAYWIALMSFYPGQAKLFPEALRKTNLLILPQLLLIGFTIFWLLRMRKRRRQSAAAATIVPTPKPVTV